MTAAPHEEALIPQVMPWVCRYCGEAIKEEPKTGWRICPPCLKAKQKAYRSQPKARERRNNYMVARRKGLVKLRPPLTETMACRGCEVEIPRTSRKGRCFACRKQYQKDYLARYMGDPANFARAKARDATRYAIRTGELKRRPCDVCGNPASEIHHLDYSKPLEVQFLCALHHVETHFPAFSASHGDQHGPA